MTAHPPTTDAPVTVEREARHDLIGYYARQRPEQADRDIANDVLEHSFDDKRMFTFRDLVLIATRSREATEERLAALASAPAGEVVEDGEAWAIYQRAQTESGFSPTHRMGGLSERLILHAIRLALARPRAAVGERSRVIEIVTDAIQDYTVGTAWTAAALAQIAADAILALQYPPVKMEGGA